jgi:hypothetical protein
MTQLTKKVRTLFDGQNFRRTVNARTRRETAFNRDMGKARRR